MTHDHGNGGQAWAKCPLRRRGLHGDRKLAPAAHGTRRTAHGTRHRANIMNAWPGKYALIDRPGMHLATQSSGGR
jgi:hypothetical protein